MEFAFAESFFDDSDDVNKKECEEVDEISYEPKQCIDKWYIGKVITPQSKCEDYHLVKFDADLLYCRNDYVNALIKYKERYSYLTVKNHALLRENCESIIRCCLNLNLIDEAVLWTSKMFLGQNNPGDSTTYHLAYQVYNRTPDKQKAVEYLSTAISTNPWYSLYWFQLHSLFKELYNDGISTITIANRPYNITVDLVYGILCKAKYIITDSLKGIENSLILKRSNELLTQVENEMLDSCFNSLTDETKSNIKKNIWRRCKWNATGIGNDWLISLKDILVNKE